MFAKHSECQLKLLSILGSAMMKDEDKSKEQPLK